MNWGLPENASTFSQVDSLWLLVLFVTAVAFVLTEGALIYFIFRYRARDGQKARYIDGNPRLELAWALIPGVILFGLAIYQYTSWMDLKVELPAPEEAVQVELAPKQFLWSVRYPGADGEFDTGDDIEAPNNLVYVPVNEPVLVRLRSKDVIHSFYVPEFRVKQDAIPGKITYSWFQATRTGEFEVLCAELCGQGHYTMQATVRVTERAEFDTWLAEQQAVTEARRGAGSDTTSGGIDG